MTNEELKAEGIVKVEIETGLYKKDKLSFNTYKAYTKTGKKYQLKFTRAVTNTPTTSGYIYVPIDSINFAKNQKFPCFWVSEVLAFEERKNNENIANYFGDME